MNKHLSEEEYDRWIDEISKIIEEGRATNASAKIVAELVVHKLLHLMADLPAKQ